MLKTVRLGLTVLVLGLLSACATPTKMGLSRSATAVDTSKKSLLLMTMRIDHAAKPSITPYPRVVYVELPGAQSKEGRFNFIVDPESGSIGPDGQEYLLRMDLEPGKYTLVGVSGSGGFAIFPGMFMLPLAAELDVRPNSVLYLGRLEGVTRDRKDNEFRAGPLIPLLDQSITGWSGSTWDINVRDAYESDMQRFRAAFGALKETKVEKQILQFDRAKAQAWWDKQ